MDASYGISVREGAELAVEQLNAAGGVNGRSIELVLHDDQSDPARAIGIATQLTSDASIVGVIGHVNSGTTGAAARIYNDPERPLLTISPTATSAELSTAGPWTFRVCATDLAHGPALARWAVNALGSRRAAVLYANDSYGRGMLASFTGAFRDAGGVVVANDPYLPALTDSVDLIRPYLERAMARNADVLMVGGELDVAMPALAMARSMGFTGPLIGGDGLLGMEEETPDARDVYITTGFLADQPGAAAQQFVRAYQARFGTLPTGDAALAYDAVNLMAMAIGEAGTDRSALRDYVASIGSAAPAYAGVTGSIAFDENGDVVNKEVVVGTIREGRLVSPRSGPAQ